MTYVYLCMILFWCIKWSPKQIWRNHKHIIFSENKLLLGLHFDNFSCKSPKNYTFMQIELDIDIDRAYLQSNSSW